MERKFVEIGDVFFELCGTLDRNEKAPARHPDMFAKEPNTKDEIFVAYKRPSQTKVEIWEGWCDWAKENRAGLHIRGANCNFFTIEGYIVNDNVCGWVVITPWHNRLWIFK